MWYLEYLCTSNMQILPLSKGNHYLRSTFTYVLQGVSVYAGENSHPMEYATFICNARL